MLVETVVVVQAETVPQILAQQILVVVVVVRVRRVVQHQAAQVLLYSAIQILSQRHLQLLVHLR
jgi:hypothetical protein